jgi:hypothetical protein
MGRWIAVGTAPGWDDAAKLTQEMKATPNWRPEPRTTITTVMVLGDGKLLAECHADKQADFEAWLEKKGWKVDSITPLKLVAQTGDIWTIR